MLCRRQSCPNLWPAHVSLRGANAARQRRASVSDADALLVSGRSLFKPELRHQEPSPTVEELSVAIMETVTQYFPLANGVSTARAFSLCDVALARHLSEEEEGRNVDPDVLPIVLRTRSGRVYGGPAAVEREATRLRKSGSRAEADSSDRPAPRVPTGRLPTNTPRPSYTLRPAPAQPERPGTRPAPRNHKRPAPPLSPAEADELPQRPAKRTRNQRRKANSPWMAKAHDASDARLKAKWHRSGGECYVAEVTHHFTLRVQDFQYSKTGWMGMRMAAVQGKQMVRWWLSGQIKDKVAGFQRIPFASSIFDQPVTYLADVNNRCWLARSTLTTDVMSITASFQVEAAQFVEKCVSFSDKEIYGNKRGDHWFSICGHDRNNKAEPKLSAFHIKNKDAINWFFRPGSPADRISRLGTKFVRIHFPQIADRFDQAAGILEDKYGIKRKYGLWYNFCLNAPRPFDGVDRVYCWPHVDFKNVAVAVCLLWVYGQFNHKEKAWLVIWEAGVVIEIPPGVFVAYPSSLFYHFNLDIGDVQLVTTSDGARPTKETSIPLDGTDGRGSCVWFTQASMIQTAETGYPTIKAAKEAGHSGVCDNLSLIDQNCFPTS